jgi:glutaminase A
MSAVTIHRDAVACEGTELTQVRAPEFIILGIFVSFLGAFVALTTMGFARNTMDGKKESKAAYWTFVASSGVSLGGSSVWTMHFIGMQALSLVTCEGTTLRNAFNATVTFVSLIAAMFCTAMAMHLVMPTTIVGEEDEIVDGTKVDRKFRVKFPYFGVIPFEKFNIKRWLISSAFLCIAACVMHYMGMAAQYGAYTMIYDPVIVFISVMIAAVAACAGLFIVVQVTAVNSIESMGLRVMASIIIGLAVNAMHYVGQAAASYKYTGDESAALTHGLFDNMTPNALNICILSLTCDIVQLVSCQHFQAKLFNKMEKAMKMLNQKLPENVQEVLDQTLEDVRPLDGGAMADYIPELAKADPSKFGICICDTDGNMYKAGDVDIPATIQSASKPLLYMLALAERGVDAVDKKVGEEPSGRPFNEISIDNTNRACNPLINTGAIACTGLLAGDAKHRYQQFEDLCKKVTHRPDDIAMDKCVYASEMSCNHDNRKIVDALLENDIIPEGTGDVALDAYTQVCSMNVTACDLAVMAATMANNGVNPCTKDYILPEAIVNKMVTVMMSCGMYNGAGKWIVEVGIPAKSGVAGMLMCVVPGRCGIAIYSPKLDVNGNTTRGVHVAKALSQGLGLHVLQNDSKDSAKDEQDKKKKGTKVAPAPKPNPKFEKKDHTAIEVRAAVPTDGGSEVMG